MNGDQGTDNEINGLKRDTKWCDYSTSYETRHYNYIDDVTFSDVVLIYYAFRDTNLWFSFLFGIGNSWQLYRHSCGTVGTAGSLVMYLCLYFSVGEVL
jgi:hypothetical protein